jgi:hypothetical protein
MTRLFLFTLDTSSFEVIRFEGKTSGKIASMNLPNGEVVIQTKKVDRSNDKEPGTV